MYIIAKRYYQFWLSLLREITWRKWTVDRMLLIDAGPPQFKYIAEDYLYDPGTGKTRHSNGSSNGNVSGTALDWTNLGGINKFYCDQSNRRG